MNELPMLHRYEHAELEQLAGRPLTNEQAQMMRRELVLSEAFLKWIQSKDGQQRPS